MGSSLGLGDVAFSGSISFSSLPQSMHSLISLAILSDWITISCNSISQILINSQFLGQLLMRRDEVWSLIIPHAFPKSSVERIIVTYPSKPNLVQHEKAFLAWSLHSSFKVHKRSKYEYLLFQDNYLIGWRSKAFK